MSMYVVIPSRNHNGWGVRNFHCFALDKSVNLSQTQCLHMLQRDMVKVIYKFIFASYVLGNNTKILNGNLEL